AIRGIVQTQSTSGERAERHRVRSIRAKGLGGPPDASITYIICLDHKVLRELTLQADAPLPDSRGPAGMAIHHIGRVADRARQRLLCGIEIGERNLVRQAVAQSERRRAESRRRERLRRSEVARL